MRAGRGSHCDRFWLTVCIAAGVVGIAVRPLSADDWRPVTTADLRSSDDRSATTWPRPTASPLPSEASGDRSAFPPVTPVTPSPRAIPSTPASESVIEPAAAIVPDAGSSETAERNGENEPLADRADRDGREVRRTLPELSISGRTAVADPLANLPGTAELSRIAVTTGILIVLAALSLAVYRHRRGWAGGNRLPEPGLLLQGSVSLGARNGLHLVSVTNRSFLVAVDARGVSCITPVPSNFADLYPLDAATSVPDEAATPEFAGAPPFRKG